MRLKIILVAGLVWTLAAVSGGGSADACSAVFVGGKGRVLAVNYDWHSGEGLLMVNKRGVSKTAMLPDGRNPAAWISKFGSITFNQYGREFPIGGLNEMGLAMQVLWLDGSDYPEETGRPAIGALQWLQHCLDNMLSVGEVIESTVRLEVSSMAELHFIACDRSATCAVIEFLNGEPTVRSAETLPVPALTNDTYTDSINALNRSLGYGGEPFTPDGSGSLDRFVRVATQLTELRIKPSEDSVADGFRLLDNVVQEDLTRWQIVYDLKEEVVHFKTAANRKQRSLAVDALDFHCLTPVQVLDLDAPVAGDVAAALGPWDPATDLEVVRAAVGRTGFLESISADTWQQRADFAEGLVCTHLPPIAGAPPHRGEPPAHRD